MARILQIALLVVVLVPFGRASALVYATQWAPLEPGDLVVTDYFGDRVVAIHNGTVFTFSPRVDGANHLDQPSGIVAAPNGDIYVVNAISAQLIHISHSTGAQTIVREPDDLLGSAGDPTNVGIWPMGVDVFENVLGLRELYVASIVSTGELWVASERLLSSGYEGSLVGTFAASASPTGFSFGGVAIRSDGGLLDSVWIAAGFDGLWAWDASDDVFSQFLVPSSNELFVDVDFPDGVLGAPVFAKVEFTPGVGIENCVPGTGGVFSAYEGVVAFSQGGLFRCPLALVFVPDRQEIYVTDTENDFYYANDGRVLRLQYEAGAWQQSIFVDSTELKITHPFGIAYVPEPGATALGGSALAVLAFRATRRRVG